ncbi:MAG: flagellar motor switch protein FliN [bacterium]|nr:flagellar motor switch protein FliN [bacterium]
MRMSDEPKVNGENPEVPADGSVAVDNNDANPDYPEFPEGMEEKPSAGSSMAAGDDNVGGMELLRDVKLDVSVELGRTHLNIGEIMDLGVGSVVELEKMAGEPVDIRVNGVLMASGEVIVLDDVFGVRITRLRSRVDRLQTFS